MAHNFVLKEKQETYQSHNDHRPVYYELVLRYGNGFRD